MRGDAARAEVLALKGDVVFGPDGPDHLQRFLEQLGALVVADAQRRELALEVAHAHREGEAAAG